MYKIKTSILSMRNNSAVDSNVEANDLTWSLNVNRLMMDHVEPPFLDVVVKDLLFT